MKICPNCRRTYDDDGLNFCLDDGSVLTLASPDAEPTVVMDYPRPTDPVAPPPARATWAPQNQPSYPVQPKKKSRAWPWVLGILATLVLVCGGGFAAFFMYTASIGDHNTNIARNTTNPGNTKANTNARTPSTSNSSWDNAGEAQ